MPQKAIVSDAFLSVKVQIPGLAWRMGGGGERKRGGGVDVKV